MQSLPQIRLLLLSAVVLVFAWIVAGNQAAAAPLAASTQINSPATSAAVPHGRLLLVLPFDDRADRPNLDWIGEAVPEVLNRRLASAGFLPISRDDRLYALDHLGLPQSFQPSRASVIRLAQNLDADDVIVGSFSTNGPRFQASAQILNMNTLHMSAPIVEEADMTRFLDVLNSLAWRIAKQLDSQYPVAQNTFVSIDSHLKIAAFENYIRGLVEPTSEGRIRHLKEAVRLDPSYSPSLLALGMAFFADQQYDQAATTLGLLPKDDPNAREADFYRGLSYIYTGSYVKAEDAFAFVSQQLPLPEVVNDQGVAASRRGKDATALFQQAIAADPDDPDYQFNLAVALAHKNDPQGALAPIGKAIKLRPGDTEAQAFQATLREAVQKSTSTGRVNASFAPASGEDSVPLERVKRTFNEASFRQAAFEMEQMQAIRLSSLPPAQHAAVLTDEGTRYLYQGLILEAERQFQAALQIDSGDATAHAGLAMVRERGGDTGEARAEAEQSVKLQPNSAAYLVLARLDLASNQLPDAAANVNHALEIEPQNSAARRLRQQLEAKGQQVP